MSWHASVSRPVSAGAAGVAVTVTVDGGATQSAARAVTRRGDLAFLTEAAPTAPAVAPAAGLLNTTGIVDGGAVSDSLDGLVHLIAALQVNLATPSHILVGPLGWSELRKLKQSATDNNVSLLGAGAVDSQQLLLSLPVIVSNAIDDHSGLVIDRTAVVSAVGTVRVATIVDAWFAADSTGLRITWRMATPCRGRPASAGSPWPPQPKHVAERPPVNPFHRATGRTGHPVPLGLAPPKPGQGLSATEGTGRAMLGPQPVWNGGRPQPDPPPSEARHGLQNVLAACTPGNSRA